MSDLHLSSPSGRISPSGLENISELLASLLTFGAQAETFPVYQRWVVGLMASLPAHVEWFGTVLTPGMLGYVAQELARDSGWEPQ